MEHSQDKSNEERPGQLRQADVSGGPSWYRAVCGVCNQGWVAEIPPNADALRAGTFCPDCRREGRMAPGVLNWELDLDRR